jgi:hypothetical protein
VRGGAVWSDPAGLPAHEVSLAAIERDLLEQAAMIISPMPALHCITDLSQTSRRVRKVPKTEVAALERHVRCTLKSRHR